MSGASAISSADLFGEQRSSGNIAQIVKPLILWHGKYNVSVPLFLELSPSFCPFESQAKSTITDEINIIIVNCPVKTRTVSIFLRLIIITFQCSADWANGTLAGKRHGYLKFFVVALKWNLSSQRNFARRFLNLYKLHTVILVCAYSRTVLNRTLSRVFLLFGI